MTYKIRRSWGPWFDRHLACHGSRIRGNFADGNPHPLQHIESLRCYEWMRQECAALELGRQTREDAFVSTVLSISSGALLAIPGLLLAKDFVLPPFREGFCLYGGLLAFGVALALALLEQIISGDAYAKQIDVSQKYYRMESRERSHTQSLKRVALLQKACVGSFAVALMLSTIGIITIGSNEHGQSPTTTPSTATTPSTSTATATATATADANPRHVR